VVASLAAALALDPAPEIMIVGGADLYREALPLADRIYLTAIDADVPGDVYFPEYDRTAWRERAREHHAADARHAYAFDWVVLERQR
jgi:dihydrofolate reductase